MNNSKLTSFFQVKKVQKPNTSEIQAEQEKSMQNSAQKSPIKKETFPKKIINSPVEKFKTRSNQNTPSKPTTRQIKPPSPEKMNFTPKKVKWSPLKNEISQDQNMEIEIEQPVQQKKRLKKVREVSPKSSPKKPAKNQNILPQVQKDFTSFHYKDDTLEDKNFKKSDQKAIDNQRNKINKKKAPQEYDYEQFSSESSYSESSNYEIEESSENEDELIARLNKTNLNTNKQITARQKSIQQQQKEEEFQQIVHKQSKLSPPKQQNKEEKKILQSIQKEKIIQQKALMSKDLSNLFKIVLSGETIVITGQFISYTRDQLTDILKELGAKVTGSVSGKTTYLLHGHILEDGRPTEESAKYKKAITMKTKLLNEDQLIDLIGEPPKPQKMEIERPQAVITKITDNVEKIQEGDNQLWTTKYKPHSIDQIIGNNGVINSIITWLQDWEKVVIQGQKKPVNWRGLFQNIGQNQENPNARACLISGPPGIGKTTFVRLLANEYGYSLIEQNASDIRNKKSIQQQTSHLSDNTLIGNMLDNKSNKKFIILMDEVDGMSGNDDRGGNQALIEMIKNTKTPIICVCNDRSNPRVRSLANHCYDRKFQRPTKVQISKRIIEILADQDNLQMDQNSIELLCESLHNDLRQIFNYLSLLSRKNRQMSYMDTKTSLPGYKMDESVMISNFDAAGKFLNRFQFDKMSYKTKLENFFVDYDLIPLLYQENYLKSMEQKGDLKDLQAMCKAAESIAQGDLIGRVIRSQQEWSLLQDLAFNSTIYPSQLVSQRIPFPLFPQWLGKNSSTRKMARLKKELLYVMGRHITCNSSTLSMEYTPTLLKQLIVLLKDQNIQGVIDFLEGYDLNPDFLKEHLVELQFNPQKNDLLASIDAKVKAGVTRTYNSKNKSSVKLNTKAKLATMENQKYDINTGDVYISEESLDEESKTDVVEVKKSKPVAKTKSKKIK